ncbi:hypothetical protein Bca52824_022169 [Brassica carinata]|uniref:GRF-type domain-containing protein n=1 Tax=Brassica carinata TaxID=52824 RepID=A0A8X8ASR9_BRACI|nr:hypothetical protein Bca52824_022169 [Brassica carinata]
MNSRNTYSQYPGYVSRLNNVQENVVQENFPYESFPSSVNIGASEIPPFSSQQSEAPSQPDDTPPARMAIADYKSMLELKMEDLVQKEKLAKLAILDTLLTKKDPLSESEEAVTEDMGLDYSYTQPSESEDYGLGDSAESGFSQTEADILLDQAEIDAARLQYPPPRLHYPPQPEVEFGFPKECYCGGDPLVATSYTRNDPGRRFYTCENVDDGDCHVWKWWDVAATEEIRAISTQCRQLSDKVDYLSFMSDYETHLNQVKELHSETEEKLVRLEKIVCDLAKTKSRFVNGFELILGVMVVVLVIIGMILGFK